MMKNVLKTTVRYKSNNGTFTARNALKESLHSEPFIRLAILSSEIAQSDLISIETSPSH